MEQMEQEYQPKSVICSVPFHPLCGTSGTSGTEKSTRSNDKAGYPWEMLTGLVPSVPPVPFPLWNGTKKVSSYSRKMLGINDNASKLK